MTASPISQATSQVTRWRRISIRPWSPSVASSRSKAAAAYLGSSARSRHGPGQLVFTARGSRPACQDRLGHLGLTADGVDRDQSTGEFEPLEQLRMGVISFDLPATASWPTPAADGGPAETRCSASRPWREHGSGARSCRRWRRIPAGRAQSSTQVTKQCWNSFGSSALSTPLSVSCEGLPCRKAGSGAGRSAAPRPRPHLDEVVGAAGRGQHQEQDLRQWEEHLRHLPSVRQRRERSKRDVPGPVWFMSASVSHRGIP